MHAYPVHFHAPPATHSSRLQLSLRILAVLVLGAAGLSLGGLFGLLYLALPVAAAVRISSRGSRRDYVQEDAERIMFILRWAAAVTSWVGLAAERLPTQRPEETIQLALDAPYPTHAAEELSASAAVARILTGLPSLVVLVLLQLAGIFVWLWAALSILLDEQVPLSAHRYLEGLQRYAYRLLAYQAGLVDPPPPFALSEDTPVGPPPTGPEHPDTVGGA